MLILNFVWIIMNNKKWGVIKDPPPHPHLHHFTNHVSCYCKTNPYQVLLVYFTRIIHQVNFIYPSVAFHPANFYDMSVRSVTEKILSNLMLKYMNRDTQYGWYLKDELRSKFLKWFLRNIATLNNVFLKKDSANYSY